MVAKACQWSQRTRLVNLSMHLRGSAYSVYRSCAPYQRTTYEKMIAALTDRFTPVRIPAVQSNLFRERKQGANESVDNYAQSLKQLFFKAYPHSMQGSKEAEEMGKSVLTWQFVAGLRQPIKEKVVGCEGSFSEFLSKARYEEVKKNENLSTLVHEVHRPTTNLKLFQEGRSTSHI